MAADLAAVLANELQGTGELQVVERSNVKAVLSEQEMAELGIVRRDGNAARRGQMTGARYIVLGTVTSYETNTAEKSAGSNFGLLGFKKDNAQLETQDYVAIDIRVVDSTTGEVVGSRTVEGRAAGTLNFGSSSSEAQRTPAAKAIRAAIGEASDYVACVLVPRGNCLARFEAKDQQRRERNRGVLRLD